MKRRSIIVYLLLTVVMITTLSVAATSNKEKESQEKGKYEKQTEKYLSKVNEELETEFDLKNEYEGYIQITFEELNLIYSGKEFGIDYKEIGLNEIIDGIDLGRRQLEIGSTEPMILIKKNGKEIVYLFKDVDYNNCINIYQYKSDEWKLSKTKEKGKNIKFTDFDAVEN